MENKYSYGKEQYRHRIIERYSEKDNYKGTAGSKHGGMENLRLSI